VSNITRSYVVLRKESTRLTQKGCKLLQTAKELQIAVCLLL